MKRRAELPWPGRAGTTIGIGAPIRMRDKSRETSDPKKNSGGLAIQGLIVGTPRGGRGLPGKRGGLEIQAIALICARDCEHIEA